ncbi:MAG: Gfo/Idh/MocA family oxidoreductase [Verrucomicrobiota bacterium]
MKKLRVACVGAGYFSQFHYEAWKREDRVDLVAACDPDAGKLQAVVEQFGIEKGYADFEELLAAEELDAVDIITPPATHLNLCRQAAGRGLNVICQKPLAPTLEEAKTLVAEMAEASGRFMVHENFRFQPWYRECARLLASGVIGRLHTLNFRCRPGDGWGPEAYLARQPYFREMERFLIFETGIHFIDTFRYLAGEVSEVYAVLRQLNPAIAGEDAGLLIMKFGQDVVGVWDANRYNEGTDEDPRYTFGQLLLEGDGGSIRLAGDGRLTVQPLGEKEREHPYGHEKKNFGADCVFATHRHFVDGLLEGKSFETSGEAYLRNLEVQEACYESAASGRPVVLS